MATNLVTQFPTPLATAAADGDFIYLVRADEVTDGRMTRTLFFTDIGNMTLGSSATVGTSGTNVIAFKNGVAPTTNPTDETQIYTEDFDGTAGDSRLCINSEAGGRIYIGNSTVARPKPTQASASVAGNALTIKSSDAVAGSSSAGAAAGGNINLTAGDAKRLTSGNANGGDIVATPGALIGSGTNGTFIIRQPGGTPGTHEGQISHTGSEFKIESKNGPVTIYTSGTKILTFGNGENLVIESSNLRVANGSITLQSRLSWPQVSSDCGFERAAAGVVRTTNGSTGNGWLQVSSGTKRVTSSVTNVTTTFANLTDLSVTVIAGRKYVGRIVLAINNALAADGFKFDLNGGTATMTSIEFGIASALGATIGTRTSTALATALTITALGDTNDVYIEIPVAFVVNAAGTVIPRQAKNADAAGATLTTRLNSYLFLLDSPN